MNDSTTIIKRHDAKDVLAQSVLWVWSTVNMRRVRRTSLRSACIDLAEVDCRIRRQSMCGESGGASDRADGRRSPWIAMHGGRGMRDGLSGELKNDVATRVACGMRKRS